MTKADLQKRLDEKYQEKRDLENVFYAIKQILWGRSSFQYKAEDIVPEIKKRMEEKLSQEGRAIGINEQLIRENAWLKEILSLIVVPTDKIERINIRKTDLHRLNEY